MRTGIAMKIRFRLSSPDVCHNAVNLNPTGQKDCGGESCQRKTSFWENRYDLSRWQERKNIWYQPGTGKSLFHTPDSHPGFSLCCSSSVNEPGSWDHLLERQHQELLETAKTIDRLASNLPKRLVNLQKRLYLLRSRFEILMLYFDIRSGNPLLLRDLMDVLDWFERRATKTHFTLPT